ncbi:phosphoethanolamine transferase [Undibacterium umbellatum]|uniref:Phosphoethanolamine transferase n=1 Tax=Undibacterium umbellatum TaxID=2762300 RepID=A0ABR6ZG77_9BURK|nr:phosphoethanolamine transferase [Undibacterium umbellatum]MBC3910737.1 phosphoethanolamine transferase [Undibacterium umbellatum]
MNSSVMQVSEQSEDMRHPGKGLGFELLSFFFLLMPFAITNGIVVAKAAALPLYGGKIVLFVLPISFLLFQLWKKSLVLKLVTAMLAVLAGAEAHVAYQFGGISGSSLFSILTTSDGSESFNYLIERSQAVALWLLLCAVSTMLAMHFSRRSHYRPGGFPILCLLCVAGYGWYIGAMSASAYLKEANANRFPTVSEDAREKLFGVGHLHPLLSTVKDTFPYGVPLRLWMFLQEEKFMHGMEQELSQFRFGAVATGPASASTQETYVLVLGETARFDRWTVNGYDRDTSPNLLKARQNGELVSMRDMITPRTFTMGSIPIYLSGRDIMREGATQKSLISAFREAGFKTYFLSTQVKKSFLNNVTTMFAAEADVQQYFESDESLGLFYDDALLAPFKKILQEKSLKKLIVLHTMGSHAIYTARYPKTFEKFPVSIDGKAVAAGEQLDDIQAASNAFDNSIRFTDHVLGEIMRALTALEGNAAMIYGSDHGETLPTKLCKFIGHGVVNEENLRVPYFVWANQAYRQVHAGKWQNLLKNEDKATMTSSNFATVLDMAGISFASFPAEHSLVREYQVKSTRMVMDMQNDELDFNTARKKDDTCGMLQARE